MTEVKKAAKSANAKAAWERPELRRMAAGSAEAAFNAASDGATQNS
ncbi:MAG TPA: hypothetical protein VLK25_05920 [Allosphingosinicella sp.]|nr:hypothetical protein [Allosphingosinicella sp.]